MADTNVCASYMSMALLGKYYILMRHLLYVSQCVWMFIFQALNYERVMTVSQKWRVHWSWNRNIRVLELTLKYYRDKIHNVFIGKCTFNTAKARDFSYRSSSLLCLYLCINTFYACCFDLPGPRGHRRSAHCFPPTKMTLQCIVLMKYFCFNSPCKCNSWGVISLSNSSMYLSSHRQTWQGK